MLDGLIPVLLTPMNADYTIDHDGFEKLICHLSNNEVSGVWALGSASEEINMGFSKKIECAKLIDLLCREQSIDAIVGTGCVSLDDHFSFIDKTSDCQFYGIHVLPYDLKMGASRTINLFTQIADYSPFPVWMYHNPKRGRSFEFETIKLLSQHDNIAGIKIGGYNLSEITKCFTLRKENFDVVAAGSGQLYSCLSLGALAHTTSEGCVYPAIFNKMISLYKSGYHDASRELQNKWIELNSQIPRTSNGEHAAEEKFLLKLQGICKEYVNRNYETYPVQYRSKLKDLHNKISNL